MFKDIVKICCLSDKIKEFSALIFQDYLNLQLTQADFLRSQDNLQETKDLKVFKYELILSLSKLKPHSTA